MKFDLSGARVFATIPIEFPVLGKITISETMVVSWIVMGIITGICIWLTRGLTETHISRKQAAAEMLVEMADRLVIGNAGERFAPLVPFVAALFSMSIISSLIALAGLRSPTADLSTEAAWAVVVFLMITAHKIKSNGVGGYLKGFTRPIPLLTPFQILSELAVPVSMACRHFGNILSGLVINGLIYGALAMASEKLLAWIPGAAGKFLQQVPILAIGIPAFTSVYFDWFTAFMQAFIFCILTVMYIRNAAVKI